MPDIGSETSNATQVQRGLFLPTKILENNLLGTNSDGDTGSSEAWLCFTKQGFSANLQAFMISYVVSVSSAYSVYS